MCCPAGSRWKVIESEIGCHRAYRFISRSTGFEKSHFSPPSISVYQPRKMCPSNWGSCGCSSVLPLLTSRRKIAVSFCESNATDCFPHPTNSNTVLSNTTKIPTLLMIPISSLHQVYRHTISFTTEKHPTIGKVTFLPAYSRKKG